MVGKRASQPFCQRQSRRRRRAKVSQSEQSREREARREGTARNSFTSVFQVKVSGNAAPLWDGAIIKLLSQPISFSSTSSDIKQEVWARSFLEWPESFLKHLIRMRHNFLIINLKDLINRKCKVMHNFWLFLFFSQELTQWLSCYVKGGKVFTARIQTDFHWSLWGDTGDTKKPFMSRSRCPQSLK